MRFREPNRISRAVPKKARRKWRKSSKREQFAFLPKRLSNGTWVWLETYRRIRPDDGEQL